MKEWSWAVVGLAMFLAILMLAIMSGSYEVTFFDIIYTFLAVPLHELVHVVFVYVFGSSAKFGFSHLDLYP